MSSTPSTPAASAPSPPPTKPSVVDQESAAPYPGLGSLFDDYDAKNPTSDMSGLPFVPLPAKLEGHEESNDDEKHPAPVSRRALKKRKRRVVAKEKTKKKNMHAPTISTPPPSELPPFLASLAVSGVAVGCRSQWRHPLFAEDDVTTWGVPAKLTKGQKTRLTKEHDSAFDSGFSRVSEDGSVSEAAMGEAVQDLEKLLGVAGQEKLMATVHGLNAVGFADAPDRREAGFAFLADVQQRTVAAFSGRLDATLAVMSRWMQQP